MQPGPPPPSPGMRRVMLIPQPMMQPMMQPMPQPMPRREVVVQRPVIKERIIPRYYRYYVEPPPEEKAAVEQARPRIVIRDRRPRPAPVSEPPRQPPVVIMHAPQPAPQEKCRTIHPGRRPQVRAVRREPRSSGFGWLGRVNRLDDESLHAAAVVAAAALCAPDYRVPHEDVIDVDVPEGARAGDTIEVSLPKEAGGGTIRASIPMGVGAGDTFEVPLHELGPGSSNYRRRTRSGRYA